MKREFHCGLCRGYQLKKILVTGGAGYIGSHMVIKLLEAQYQPIVIDDLSTGSKLAVPKEVPLYVMNIQDKLSLSRILSSEKIDAVLHFAASIDVSESVQNPAKYYHNNVMNTLNLVEVMLAHEIKTLVFSSTAAIFGEPQRDIIDETHPKNPINPYGQSKIMCEQILKDFDQAYGLRSICLRYFNAAGADALGRASVQPVSSKNLIPSVLQAAQGKRAYLEVFGRDYPTHDGTCIRDFIHVMDLCDAHLLALEHLFQHQRSGQYNLGNGRGYSVQEVIDATKNVTGKDINIIHSPRRLGDPSVVIADPSLARKDLHWQPVYTQLETMIDHAWQWHYS